MSVRSLRRPSTARATASTVGIAAALVGATSASAQLAYPPPPAAQVFETIEENPYFVQDEQDPRILHAAPGAQARGIDRGYVERMARPAIPAATLDRLQRLLPEVEVAPLLLPDGPAVLPNAATIVNGNIIVIEGENSFVAQTAEGLSFDHNGNGLQRVVSDVWTRVGDEFDFITVFSSFDDAGVAAYYLPLQQTVTGLGECNFNTGDTFGCVFSQLQEGSTLQGFVFMNSLNYWRNWDRQMDGVVHPITNTDHSLYAVLGQEVAHRWGSGLRFVDPRTDQISGRLLGRDNSHWAGWVDSDASVMDGVDWIQKDNGDFLAVDDMARFSTLDLYTMGALPVGKAEPFFFIDNARFIPNRFVDDQLIPAELTTYLPSIEFLAERGVELEATGDRIDLTIQDIVNAEGNRCPDPDHTQKEFKQAIVLVTRPGQTAAQVAAEVAELETARVMWEDWWRDNTGRRLSLCTDLGGAACPHAEVQLAGGAVESDNESVDPGSSLEVLVEVTATGAEVTGARLLVTLAGNGAENATLDKDDLDVGDLAPGETKTVRVPVTLAADYPCGSSITVQAQLQSDNAETKDAGYRVYPGYKEMVRASFGSDDNLEFFVDDEGADTNESGAFIKQDVQLSCDMTPRTPERDFSPDDQGAFVTGARDELSGNTSLWSDRIDLEGAIDPEIRIAFWFDGDGGEFAVQLSDDASEYKTVKTFEDGFHEWSNTTINVAEAFDGQVPGRLWVRFVATGDGVEAGVDDFLVLDRVGQCAAQVTGPCNCDASSDTDAPVSGMALFAVGVLFFVRRRARSGTQR